LKGSMTPDEVATLRDDVDRLIDGMARLVVMVDVLQRRRAVDVPTVVYESDYVPPVELFDFVVPSDRMQ